MEKLFEKFESAKGDGPRRKIFEEIADALAIHAAIEEAHFYPAVKAKQTEDLLLEAVEEHLEIKRVIADLLGMEAADDSFQAEGDRPPGRRRAPRGRGREDPLSKGREDFRRRRAGDDCRADGTDGRRAAEAGNARNAVPSQTDSAAPV